MVAVGVVLARNESRGAEDTELLRGLSSGQTRRESTTRKLTAAIYNNALAEGGHRLGRTLTSCQRRQSADLGSDRPFHPLAGCHSYTRCNRPDCGYDYRCESVLRF